LRLRLRKGRDSGKLIRDRKLGREVVDEEVVSSETTGDEGEGAVVELELAAWERVGVEIDKRPIPRCGAEGIGRKG
jgi:hypothetical protein